MSKFNTLSNIDDYLAPAQDCVVAPILPSKEVEPEEESNKSIKIEIEDDLGAALDPESQKPNIIKSKDQVASITLADCLACSGCVTTAETMLI
jgi:hypothetical protein